MMGTQHSLEIVFRQQLGANGCVAERNRVELGVRIQRLLFGVVAHNHALHVGYVLEVGELTSGVLAAQGAKSRLIHLEFNNT